MTFKESQALFPLKHVWLLIWHCSFTDGKEKNCQKSDLKTDGRARASWIRAKLMDRVWSGVHPSVHWFFYFVTQYAAKAVRNLQHWLIPKLYSTNFIVAHTHAHKGHAIFFVLFCGLNKASSRVFPLFVFLFFSLREKLKSNNNCLLNIANVNIYYCLTLYLKW